MDPPGIFRHPRTMLILIAVSLLLLAPLAMAVIRRVRPRFGYFWLVAAGVALAAWPLVLLARLRLRASFSLPAWGLAGEENGLFSLAPTLILDEVSWAYALAVMTLVLAVILTDVARVSAAGETGTDWAVWASCLGVGALGLLAVMSANPLTLLLAWAAMDAVELVIYLSQVKASAGRERVVVAFSARAAGIVLVVLAGVIARAGDGMLTFEAIRPEIGLILFLAAGLRLGVLPLHLPFHSDPHLLPGLGTLLRLVPTAASLLLLTRTAIAVNASGFAGAGLAGAVSGAFGGALAAALLDLGPILLGLTGLTALYAGLSWLTARDAFDGRAFWVLGMAALAVASALRAQPAASLAWGLALLLSGGLLFMITARHRNLIPLVLLGGLAASGLPLTPSWDGLRLYAPPFTPLVLIFLLAQALLLAGYLHHGLNAGVRLGGVERWVWLIYPWGLAMMPAASLLIAVWGRPLAGAPLPWGGSPLLSSWPAAVVLALGALLGFGRARGLRLPPRITAAFRSLFSFEWLYRILWNLFHALSRLVAFFNAILEGEGGILWTLLLLTLLLAILVQRGAER